MTEFKLKPRYSRSDPRGLFPERVGVAELELNRLAIFWRPIIDLTDSDLAPMRLRLAAVVAAWIADPPPGRRLWFSRIGVPGLRHQVLRHAGLRQWDCREPTELAGELRTPAWSRLVEAIERFAGLDDWLRSLVVFQLAQLSYCQYAADLAGVVMPNGDPAHDWFGYEVARVASRHPGYLGRAMPVMEQLAYEAKDLVLALSACFQLLGYALHGRSDLTAARAPEERGRLLRLPEGWHSALVRSRFHRALALVRLREGRYGQAASELRRAIAHGTDLFCEEARGELALIAAENRSYLLEAELNLRMCSEDGSSSDDVRRLCTELVACDPNSVEARLAAGDGYASIGDHREAARWYVRAGELETVSGAQGWYRAAQCYEWLDDLEQADFAMAKCLELDASAVEPRRHLLSRTATGPRSY